MKPSFQSMETPVPLHFNNKVAQGCLSLAQAALKYKTLEAGMEERADSEEVVRDVFVSWESGFPRNPGQLCFWRILSSLAWKHLTCQLGIGSAGLVEEVHQHLSCVCFISEGVSFRKRVGDWVWFERVEEKISQALSLLTIKAQAEWAG